MNIFASCIVCGLMFEIAFFFGHYLEHVLPTAYRKYHLLHHTTKADTAISGYYMTGNMTIIEVHSFNANSIMARIK